MLQKVYCNVLNSIYFLAFAILIKFSIVLLQIVKLIPLWNIMSFISASLDSFKRKRCVLQSHRPRQELQFHCLYEKKNLISWSCSTQSWDQGKFRQLNRLQLFQKAMYEQICNFFTQTIISAAHQIKKYIKKKIEFRRPAAGQIREHLSKARPPNEAARPATAPAAGCARVMQCTDAWASTDDQQECRTFFVSRIYAFGCVWMFSGNFFMKTFWCFHY